MTHLFLKGFLAGFTIGCLVSWAILMIGVRPSLVPRTPAMILYRDNGNFSSCIPTPEETELIGPRQLQRPHALPRWLAGLPMRSWQDQVCAVQTELDKKD